MKKAQNAEELKLKSSFESLRAALSDGRFSDRMEFPLAFWTLPNDRRLPISLLDYPLRRVLTCDFDQLASTPGIGLKKLHSLMLLLQRAAKDAPPSVPITAEPMAAPAEVEPAVRFRPVDNSGRFDPSLVSEALWREWRETAEEYGLGEEKLGRLAPSLLELPTVIWETPLKAYLPQSIHEIRNLRTHGEKRVRVILEVFFVLHEMLHNAGHHPRLCIRLVPTFVPHVERWFHEMLVRSFPPTLDEIRDQLAVPLLEQLKLDVGAEVIHLVKGRLGIDSPRITVRQQSRDLGVTRARIYQLLEECDRVMSVRWPEGRRQFQELYARMEREAADSPALELLTLVYELFFPRKYEKVEAVLGQG
jgi:hypothetical protein